jgi:hypothetical protein
MKNCISLIIIANFFALQVYSQTKMTGGKTSENPIFKGWYADPEAIIFDNQYWIYPTYSAPYEKQVFMDAFSSPDLVNWTKHERIIDTAAVKWVQKALWAPAIVKKDNKYFLFFGGNDIQNDSEYGGIGIAVADKPEGPFKDYLGKPLIDRFYNGAQPIDQFVFQDKDGSYLLYYGGWGHCNVVKLNSDFRYIVPFEDGTLYKEVTPENYVEGPFMFIKEGKYYFMWSEGGWTGPDYSVAYAIADSPFGPFKRIGKILQQDAKIGTGAGHHSVIHEPESNKWYIVYHRRPLTETDGAHRVTCIDEMRFDENGHIKPVEMTFEGVERNGLGFSERFAPMLTVPRGYVCYKPAGPIHIDGLLNESSWNNAPKTDAFADISGYDFPKPQHHTSAKMLWDDKYLYIAAELEEPHIWATLRQHDAVVYYDNDFEVFIDPEGEGHNYFEIETNALGTVFDLSLTKPYRASRSFVQIQWDCPGLKLATHCNGKINDSKDEDQSWTVEMAIPHEAIANNFVNYLKAGSWLRINFSRVEWQHDIDSAGNYIKKKDAKTGKDLPEDNWVWTPTGQIAMHMPERWGYVYLSDMIVGKNTETFYYPDSQPIYRFLWMLFYVQEEQYAGNRSYFKQLADFNLSKKDMKLLPPGYRIQVEATSHTYEITAFSSDGKQYVINESGRCFSR